MSREEMKSEIKAMVSDLRAMADEFEELSSEMDSLTDKEFDEKSLSIQDKYSSKGIELF